MIRWLIDFRFAVQYQPLAWFQAPFEVTAVKKFAGELAGGVANQQMKHCVASAHGTHRLATHDLHANGINAVGLNVFYIGKIDAVFVTERQVGEQVFERVDAALGQQFCALRANALDHAYISGEGLRGHDGKAFEF